MGSDTNMAGRAEMGGIGPDEASAPADRRRALYWVGFLDGAKTSRRVRVKEVDAIAREAEAFQRFFRDPSAKLVAEAATRAHLADEKRPVDQVNDLVVAMRGPLYVGGALSVADRIDEFLGFCAGIIADGKVHEAEALAIKRRFELDPELAQSAKVAKIYRVVADALMDGNLDDDEQRDIRKWIVRLAGDGYAAAVSQALPPHLPEMIADQRAIVFEDRVFVVAGVLGVGPGYEIASMLGALGGELADEVSHETDFLIVAHDAARDWLAGRIASEIDAARRLIANGAGLKFVSEQEFEAALRAKAP